MPSRASKFVSLCFAFFLVFGVARSAHAQACCAAGAAVTPARLALHEDVLAGAEVRAAAVYGSYAASGEYRKFPAGTSELEFRQQLLGAVRVFERGQLALAVPFVETYRKAAAISEFGGGLADLNLSGRYDFILAGAERYIPGIAVLAGVSLPTGTSVDSAENALATDATGIGTTQAHVGLALEQSYDSWLFGLSGTVAYRLPHTVSGIDSELSPEWWLLGSIGYEFAHGSALAIYAVQTFEGTAEVAGRSVRDSDRRRLTLGVSSALQLTEDLRINTGLSFNPPLGELGKNYPASAGATLVLVRTWS